MRIWIVILLLATALTAQDKHSTDDLSTRSVQGVVTDAAGNPREGAVVQLKDTKTLQIRSFRTTADGSYHFAGLSPNVEYELKADADGVWTATKTLSIFSSKKNKVINLKLKK